MLCVCYLLFVMASFTTRDTTKDSSAPKAIVSSPPTSTSPDLPAAAQEPDMLPSIADAAIPVIVPAGNQSQVSAMTARYKCYQECTNSLFEEKDLVSIK